MKATLILFAGPCAGNFDVVDWPWPPPRIIRAAHDGEGKVRPLRVDDEPAAGEDVVQYELHSRGSFEGRGATASDRFATYYRIGRAPAARPRATAISAQGLEAIR